MPVGLDLQIHLTARDSRWLIIGTGWYGATRTFCHPKAEAKLANQTCREMRSYRSPFRLWPASKSFVDGAPSEIRPEGFAALRYGTVDLSFWGATTKTLCGEKRIRQCTPDFSRPRWFSRCFGTVTRPPPGVLRRPRWGKDALGFGMENIS